MLKFENITLRSAALPKDSLIPDIKSDFDRYVSGVIAAALGMTERAEREFLQVGGEYERLSPKLVIPDVREGEYAISTVWIDLYRRVIAEEEKRPSEDISDAEVLRKRPIPYALDFRMH